MNDTAKTPKRRRTLWALVTAFTFATLVSIVVIVFFWSGLADRYARNATINAIARVTGGRVELREMHVHPLQLRVTLGDLTIHGREPEGTPPFFHADRLEVGLRIDSFWGRKVSVGKVEVTRPGIHIRLERDGSSNVPVPPGPRTGTPIRQRLFQVVVRRLRLDDGELLFNDQRIPLVAQGGRLDLAVDYSDAQNRRMYLGDFRWQQVVVAARTYRPFPSDLAVRFSLEPDAISVTQLAWTLPHTSVDAQFSLSNFAHPQWTFRYRGKLDLADIRTILVKPRTPSGQVDFTGDGRWADGSLALTGSYSASGIGLREQWFHTKGMSSRGSYHADGNRLEVPDFSARALGGIVNGRVELQFHGVQFRVIAHAQGMNLAAILAAVNNPKFPVTPLHWNSAVDVQGVTTWSGDFHQVESQGVSRWMPKAQLGPGEIPVTAQLNYDYSMVKSSVSILESEISTPSSRIQMNGGLGARDTAIEVVFDAQDLTPWDDFINRLRGVSAEPEVISGSAHWQGRMTGRLEGPTFSGHVKGNNARYGRFYWDEIEGDMSYSPDEFTLTRADARRGRSSAQLEISITLDGHWSFRPESPWSFDATLVRTETDGLQSLLGFSFPISGLLSGDFHGKGTRADPDFNGLFDVISPEAWGWKFDRFRGQISLRHGEVRISNAELRLPPPPTAAGAASSSVPGLLTGNFLYRTVEHEVVFDLTGAALPLEGVSRLQTPRLPVGGRLSFQLSGRGPLLTPTLQGSLRLVDLKLGSEVIGSFGSTLHSDGRQLTLQVDSAMSTGSLHGSMQVALRGDFPVTSRISIAQLDLDPLIAAALHLSALTGHGQADGQFTISGGLLRPETLTVQANLTHFLLDFEYVKLENQGPVRLQYGNSEIRVEQANLRGVDNDFHLSGFARFTRDRALSLQMSGQVNLRLFDAFVPNLDARGPAQVDAAIGGTLSSPRITGRVRLQNAGLRYGDFPAGLSQLSGDLVFDANRLVFDNLSAQTGGGQLHLAGSVGYGSGPMRFDLSLRSDQVRIRYPIGMSWLTGGTLQLTGTARGATLSGRVTVDRLLLSDNFDFTSLLSSSNEPVNAPTTASPFLRNLQFDVQAVSTSNARLQWSSGSSQTEASLRVRGTWEHPILLGNIHLLGGEMQFRGSQYQLSRGDINFVNPFRLDPVLDIEAVTRIRQYEITVDFAGPASHMTMSYRSDPPLPSNDIITLLALGQTGEQSQLRGTSAVQTPEMGATTLLSEAISSQLGGRVQRLFGISRFSVDPSYLSTTTSGQNPAARVTIQQQFNRNLVLSYSTDVTSTQQQVIQIEYTILPNLSLVALRDANGTFGIDIIRKTRFK